VIRSEDSAFAAPDPCALHLVHTIGTIQPHGLLFAVTAADLIVRRVSANVETFLGMPAAHVVGRSLELVFGRAQCNAFRVRLAAGDLWPACLRLRLGPNALEMDCTARAQDDIVVVELELVEGGASSETLSLSARLQAALLRMEQATDLVTLVELAASETRRVSGFDRVMVYRFDDSWAGEVIAEAMAPDPVAYLGLHFPASDIPPQARRLFIMNRLRTIADVSAEAVPIVSEAGPQGLVPLDLTFSSLRSAAPIHLEYLRNMGVQASMTISIIVDHQLWGMIACHHRTPLRLDPSSRTICELIGLNLNAQVALRIENAALGEQLATRQSLEAYMTGVERMAASQERRRFETKELLTIFGADGCVSRIGGVVSYRGKTVPEESLQPVIDKLRALSLRGIASSNKLSTLEPSAARYKSGASGALYVGLAHGSGDYLMLLRRELVETIDWAGNPDKTLTTDRHGQLAPRTSFAVWQETLRGRSLRWTEAQLDCARFLREQLLRVGDARRLREAERRIIRGSDPGKSALN
jgi:light-regulated signal transduction histidine kinase (bacteriophytochrome)